MGTPKEGYFLKDGTRIPGTTTIIGRFKESAGLLQWAFQQGKAGKAHLYEEAEKAADIGTTAHSMVEAHIKGLDPLSVLDTFAGDKEKVRSAFTAYLNWERMTCLKIIECEVMLVSEQYRFGGTLDAIVEMDGKLSIGDFKTSNAIYQDHLIQIAAYRHLWNENFPDRQITGGNHIFRFSKECGDFAHHHWPNLDEAFRQFVLFREAYDIDRVLKKRAA